ncbi:hypothetical protein ENUP19_0040G0009 [Entamoeba nuttalli]|uniref:RanBD1 domain-containing protein n=1 Tax=Entamoeba nuttalli TaxID=412467 RepID=A0ABQ0D9T9_9EUKA
MHALSPKNLDFDTLIDQLHPGLPQPKLLDIDRVISIDTHFPRVFSTVLTKRLNLHNPKSLLCDDDLKTLKSLRSTKAIHLRGEYTVWLKEVKKEQAGIHCEESLTDCQDSGITTEKHDFPTSHQNKEVMKEATHMTPQSVIEIKQGNLKEEDKKENNITEEDKNKIKEEEKQEELIENISNYYGEESKIKNYIRANEIEKRRKEVELGKEIEEEIAMIIGGISDDVKQIEVISREIIDKCKKDKDKREGIIMKIIESMLRNEIVVTTNPNRVHVYGEIIGNICFEWKEYRDQIITKIRSISPVFNSIYPKRTDKIEYEMIMKYKTKESDEKYFNRIRHSFKILTGILMSEVGDQTILLDIVMNGMYMQYDNKEVCLGRVGDLIGSMVEIMLDECGDKLKHTEYMPRVIQTIKEYLPIAQSHWEGKGPQGDYVMRKIKVLLQRYEKNLPFNKKVVDYQKELADYKKQIGLESCVWENTTKIKVVDTNEIHSKDNITTQENEEEHKDNITTERIEEESNKNTVSQEEINKESDKEENQENTEKQEEDNIEKQEEEKKEENQENTENQEEDNKDNANTKENNEEEKDKEEEKRKILEDDPEAEADIYFKPIIELKEIEQKEMEEEIVFKERGICVRYDTINEEFKERGRGEIEILKHPKTKLSRVILIRDQIFKLACDHYILPYIKIKEFPNNRRAIIYSVYEDYAQDEGKNTITFGMCFNNEEIKERFIKTFKELQEETQQIVNNKEEKQETTEKKEEKQETTENQEEKQETTEKKEENIEKKEENIEKKKVNIEEKGDDEERNRKIFNYQEFDIFGGKNPYDNMTTRQEIKRNKGIDIRKEESEQIKENTEGTEIKENAEKKKEEYKENTEFKAFDFSNILNKETDNNTTMINTQAEKTYNKIEEINIKNETENQEKTQAMNIQEYDNPQPHNNTEQKIEETPEIYNLSHEQQTTLTQNENHEITKEEEKRKILEDDPEAEADIYFKPIIELKEIEQKEMEEEIVFKERGICVRYDTINEEFKERGRGEIEILKHPKTKLSRVILIRDQIFKLACDHYILPYIKIKEFPNNRRAIIYSVYEDYAQDEGKNTITFGMCFNNEEIKERFIKTFKELQEETQQIVNKK